MNQQEILLRNHAALQAHILVNRILLSGLVWIIWGPLPGAIFLVVFIIASRLLVNTMLNNLLVQLKQAEYHETKR